MTVNKKRKEKRTIVDHVPLSECECMECLKDEYCQACEDFGHQKEEDYV